MLCRREVLQLKFEDIWFQVGVPLEVVHLTDEYWKNVVCIILLIVFSLGDVQFGLTSYSTINWHLYLLTYNCLMFYHVYEFKLIIIFVT